MKSIRTLLTNLSLRRKIVFIILLVNLVLFGGVITIALRIVSEENNKLLYRATAALLSYSATDVGRALQDVERLSQLLISDPTIQEQLSAIALSDSVIIRGTAYRLLTETLQTYLQQFSASSISYISIYGSGMGIHTDTTRAQKLPAYCLQTVLQAGEAAQGAASWVSNYTADQGLFLARAVRRIKPMNLDVLGTVIICVNFDKVVEGRTDIGAVYEQAYYLVSRNDVPLYTSSGLPKSVTKAAAHVPKNGYKVLSMDGEPYFAVRGFIPEYDWQFVTLVSYASTQEAIEMANLMFLLVAILCFGLSCWLCSILAARIAAHFDSLIQKMHIFGENETALVPTQYDYSTRQDEIGQLHRQFDSMAQQIIQYIETDYTTRLMMKDAQIKALEAQIDPHFLYNVLASIGWRAKAIGEERVEQMVQALGRLLRTTLSDAEEHFTLAKELALVDSYMTIQQIRFEDELQFESHVPQYLLDAEIPKLSLQPLVENAIRHGLEETTELCAIHIAACLCHDALEITVSNTGSQFPDDLLEKLEAGDVEPHGFGIGILNIQKRLHLMFGGTYGLQFYNENGRAVVQMHIPYRPLGK